MFSKLNMKKASRRHDIQKRRERNERREREREKGRHVFSCRGHVDGHVGKAILPMLP